MRARRRKRHAPCSGAPVVAAACQQQRHAPGVGEADSAGPTGAARCPVAARGRRRGSWAHRLAHVLPAVHIVQRCVAEQRLRRLRWAWGGGGRRGRRCAAVARGSQPWRLPLRGLRDGAEPVGSLRLRDLVSWPRSSWPAVRGPSPLQLTGFFAQADRHDRSTDI